MHDYKEMTVEYLYEMTKSLVENGYKDMKIKCGDNFIYEDDWTRDYVKNTLEFKGSLYNEDSLKDIYKLKRKINDAIEDYYNKL